PLAPRLVGALGVARARLEDEATVAPPGELAPARTEARVEHLALPDGVLRARAGHAVERGAVAGDEEGRAGAEVDVEHLALVDVDPRRVRAVGVHAHHQPVVADAADDRAVLEDLEARDVAGVAAVD